MSASDVRLSVLARLAGRLLGARSLEAAAGATVSCLGDLGVAASVSAIHADVAQVLAIHVGSDSSLNLTSRFAGNLVGMRVPIDGVEALRQPVRLRRPFYGVAGATATLRSLLSDAAAASAVPSSSDEGVAASVPVIARDRVLGVISAWGSRCSRDVIPTLQAAAAMLASAWPALPDVQERPVLRGGARPDREMRATIQALLRGGQIVAAAQPIVRLYDQSIIGYEALARFPPAGSLTSPDALFAAAAAVNLQSDVDMACLRAALQGATNFGEADLFVNVLVGTVLNRQGMHSLLNAVQEAHLDPASIVLEFSEREPVTDLTHLQRIAADLRSSGFRIAVDDAGAGHASMRVIAELRPEFIKLDRSLIHALDTDRARRALVVALLSFSGHIGARLIAEGVETQMVQEALTSLGVQFAQGWHLGRPVASRPVDGHQDLQVVDAMWFARRPVSRALPSPVGLPMAVPAPAATLGDTAKHRQRRGLARALSDAALALQSEHDPMRILNVMADQMRRVVPVSEMAIFVADYETHRLMPVLATGEDSDEILADSFSLDAGLTGWAFGLGTPQNIGDTSAHPLARQVPGTAVVQESLLLVPLVAMEHKLGIINCWRLGVGEFSARDLEAATLFAHIAASAWRNAQLYAELMNAAMTDPLTHLYNSRWLHDTGERDLTRAHRDKQALSLLLVDLDHFKTVNDSAGHAVGDLLLQRVANRLCASVRGADAVVRLGGEEFVVLLHDCDVHGAAVVAGAVLQAVRDIALPEGCGIPQLTVSIGVAAYPEHGRDLDQLLAAADRAMYMAKRGGRDRLALAGERPVGGGTVVSFPQPNRRQATESA